MKLTRRQEEFIKNTLEMREEMNGPFRYAELAERLGVSPFTAYDMLRVLEKKGFITSEYQLAADKSGPGRAERLFYPSPLALERYQKLSQASHEARALEGEALRQFLNHKIETDEMPHGEVDLEILARIPPVEQGPMAYCLEVLTVLTLNLTYYDKHQILTDNLVHIVPEEPQVNRAHLCLVAGIALGILIELDADDPEWMRILFEHVHKYTEIVMTLDETECRELREHLLNTFKFLEDNQFLS